MGSPLRYSSEDLSSKYDLDRGVVREAFDHFDRGSAILLAFSGKIGAGKDTVAPLTFGALKRPDFKVHTDAFGLNLKAELDVLIQSIIRSSTAREATGEIAGYTGVTPEEAGHTVELLLPDIEAGILRSGYEKTAGSRLAIQYWATEVRRARDPLYWVKPVLARVMDAAAEGLSTQITDVRFFTEAWSAIDGGGWTVRLDVSPEEQRRRILARDGIEISEAAKRHSSETELDGFQRFAVRINTDEYSSSQGVARAAARGIRSVGAL